MSKPTRIRVVVPRPAWTREIDQAIVWAQSDRREDSGPTLAWLSREVRERRAFWWKHGRRPSQPLFWVFLGVAVTASQVTVGSFLSGASFTVLGCCVIPLSASIAAAAWLAVFTAVVTDTEHARRISADGRTCPECQYDLTGVPPAIPTVQLEGVSIGPRSCPECGVAWPCVPPPVR
jgi:hypothetical protein